MTTPRRIVVIGAARSGTKILRDSLAAATGGGAVPYDVNFVWRYGNESTLDDVLTPRDVTPRSARFIGSYIDKYARSGIVIEKTVSNSLRVPFVHSVLPDAAFVHIVRDGVDVVESSRTQWEQPIDRRYLRQKIRHFPLRLTTGYGRKYVAAKIRRHRQNVDPDIWGVRYPGIDRDLRSSSLLTVCARQWREPVVRSGGDLADVDVPVVHVRYEELVADPERMLGATLIGLDLPHEPSLVREAAASIVDGSRGRGAERLSVEELQIVGEELDETLLELGYPRASDRRGS